MLWCAVQTPFVPALTIAIGAWVLPTVALVVAAVPVGLLAYQRLVAARPYRPALRAMEGGRAEFKLRPA